MKFHIPPSTLAKIIAKFFTVREDLPDAETFEGSVYYIAEPQHHVVGSIAYTAAEEHKMHYFERTFVKRRLVMFGKPIVVWQER